MGDSPQEVELFRALLLDLVDMRLEGELCVQNGSKQSRVFLVGNRNPIHKKSRRPLGVICPRGEEAALRLTSIEG